MYYYIPVLSVTQTVYGSNCNKFHSYEALAKICRLREVHAPKLLEENCPVLQWWSPRLGHGAVLAASKPLQVSKYMTSRAEQ